MTKTQILCSIVGAMAAVASATAAWLNYSSTSKTSSVNSEKQQQSSSKLSPESISVNGIRYDNSFGSIDVSKCKGIGSISGSKTNQVAAVARIAPHENARAIQTIQKDDMIYVCESRGQWQKVLFEYRGIVDHADCNIKFQTLPPETPRSFCLSGWLHKSNIQL